MGLSAAMTVIRTGNSGIVPMNVKKGERVKKIPSPRNKKKGGNGTHR